MSDTIEVRRQLAQRSSLFQQRPSTLLDAVESRARADSYRSHAFYGGGPAINVHVVGLGSLGHLVTAQPNGVVFVADDDYPTAGVSFASDNVPAGQMDWVSTEANIWTRWVERTTGLLRQRQVDMAHAPSAASRLRVDRLAAIQAALGLPVQTLAEVLQISRPGLYKWLDASKDISMHDANRERLAVVERVAKAWRERESAPLSSVAHEPLAAGDTVLGLLVAEHINEADVMGAFDQLIAKLRAKPKSRSQKLADAGFKRRPSARALPADE